MTRVEKLEAIIKKISSEYDDLSKYVDCHFDDMDLYETARQKGCQLNELYTLLWIEKLLQKDEPDPKKD